MRAEQKQPGFNTAFTENHRGPRSDRTIGGLSDGTMQEQCSDVIKY